MRELLIRQGLQEFLTCDLISPTLSSLCFEKELGKKEEIAVIKPSSLDQSILRMSLLPGLLNAVLHNFDRKNREISAFEIGQVHFKEGEHYRERLSAAILLTGNRSPYHFTEKGTPLDFFDLKGILESILEGASYHPSHLTSFHPGKQAAVYLGDSQIGVMGEVHPALLERIGIESSILFAQLDLEELMAQPKKPREVQPLPLYPGSERDWTLTLQKELSVQRIFEILQNFRSKLLKEVILLDLFESEKLGKGVKNVTFRFTYRSDSSTVEQQEVDREHQRMMEKVESKLKIDEPKNPSLEG